MTPHTASDRLYIATIARLILKLAALERENARLRVEVFARGY